MLKTFNDICEAAQLQIKCLDARSAKILYDEYRSIGAHSIIIDVREKRTKDSKLTDAIHISRGMLEYHIQKYTNPEQIFFTHCNHGARSSLAALSLQNMGYTNVYVIRDEIANIIREFG